MKNCFSKTILTICALLILNTNSIYAFSPFGGDNVLEKIEKTAAKKIKNVKDVVVDKAKNVKDAVVDKAKDIKDAVVDKAKDVKDAVVDKAKDVKEAVVDKYSKVTSKVNSFFNKDKTLFFPALLVRIIFFIFLLFFKIL